MDNRHPQRTNRFRPDLTSRILEGAWPAGRPAGMTVSRTYVLRGGYASSITPVAHEFYAWFGRDLIVGTAWAHTTCRAACETATF